MTAETLTPALARFFDAVRPFLSGEESPARFAERLGPSPSGEARLAVYPRLVSLDWSGVLDKLYGATRHALEEHAPGSWLRLRTALTRELPPDHWDLNETGRPLPDWLAARREAGEDLPPFVEQLADFEWLEFATWTAPDAPPRASAPDAPLRVDATVQVRQYSHAVPAYARAVRRGERPAPPAAKRTTAIVHRKPDDLLVYVFYPSLPGLLALARAEGAVDDAMLEQAGVTPELRASAEETLVEQRILHRAT